MGAWGNGKQDGKAMENDIHWLLRLFPALQNCFPKTKGYNFQIAYHVMLNEILFKLLVLLDFIRFLVSCCSEKYVYFLCGLHFEALFLTVMTFWQSVALVSLTLWSVSFTEIE